METPSPYKCLLGLIANAVIGSRFEYHACIDLDFQLFENDPSSDSWSGFVVGEF